MQTTKKKPSLIFILVGAVLAGYLGYLINGAWTEGIAFNAVSYTHLDVYKRQAIDLMSYVDIFTDYESNKLALGILEMCIRDRAMVGVIVADIVGTGSGDSAARKLFNTAPSPDSSYSYYETVSYTHLEI